LYRFDYASHALTQVDRVSVGMLASFLAVDAPRSALFVADEGDGNLRRLSLDVASHAPLRSAPSTVKTAGHPVHVTATRSGAFALVAEYSEGKAESFGASGGAISRSVDVESPGAQAHEVVLAPDERFAFVPCKGSDTIARFGFDSATGALTALTPMTTRSGDGPRHLAVSPSGAFAYVITELSSTVIAYDYKASDGSLAELMRTTSLPPNFSGTSAAAEIALTASGKRLYASNRITGENGDVAAFGVGADGRVTSIGHQTTGGRTPRSFAIDPTDRFIFVGNQESNSVAVLSIDATTGALGAPETTDIGITPYVVVVAPFTE
jgi:6-phosphogluconolactonase (cycloisomerase 2 family)